MLAAVTMIAVGTGLTGCSFIMGVPTTDGTEGRAVGANLDLGEIKIRSLLIVTTDAGEPGRLLGMLFNPTDDAVEVTIADDDDSVTVAVPARGSLGFDTTKTVFDTVAEIPGAYTPVIVTTEGIDVLDRIPVMDGSLNWYLPYVPDAD